MSAMQTPPLTRSVGTAERAMRALLERQLEKENLSFGGWTALAFTSAGPLSAEQIVQRQIAGHTVSDASDGRRSVDALISAGQLAVDQAGMLAHTEKGAMLFRYLSAEIEGITQTLYGDLPAADLDATHRTLVEIGKRANSLLAQ